MENEEHKTTEWCSYCGQETEIDNKIGGYCNTCGKFLKPCSMCDMDKVNCNECKIKIPKKYVYVVNESGVWQEGGLTEETCNVFDSFSKAKAKYDELIKSAKNDMLERREEEDLTIEESLDEEGEYAYFSIYETSYYPDLHDDISILKKEIQ